MVTVPLGQSAYKRQFAGEPEIKLINRFLEKNPANLIEHVALLTRPGSTSLGKFPGGRIHATYSKTGLFSGDLFIASGPSLYRLTTTNVVLPITGTIVNNNTFVYGTWMKGIGYEFLFVSDGQTLQFYSTRALGTLSLTGSGGANTPQVITDFRSSGQVIEIGGTYYGWSADVNSGTRAGTSANPYLALLGTAALDSNGLAYDASSLSEMASLLNFSGISGFDYSSTVPGANPNVTATATATALAVTAIQDLAAGNLVTTSIFSGSNVAWAATTLTGGGNQALQTVTGMGAGELPGSLTSVSNYVLVGVAGTNKFYFINPGETVIDPLNFASKESNPDNITSMTTVGDQAIICGDGSTENWYATGDFSAPFAPVKGRVYRRGCLAGTECAVGDSLFLVGEDGVVYMIGYNYGDTSQYGVHRVSTHAIEERIRVQMRLLQGLPT